VRPRSRSNRATCSITWSPRSWAGGAQGNSANSPCRPSNQAGMGPRVLHLRGKCCAVSCSRRLRRTGRPSAGDARAATDGAARSAQVGRWPPHSSRGSITDSMVLWEVLCAPRPAGFRAAIASTVLDLYAAWANTAQIAPEPSLNPILAGALREIAHDSLARPCRIQLDGCLVSSG